MKQRLPLLLLGVFSLVSLTAVLIVLVTGKTAQRAGNPFQIFLRQAQAHNASFSADITGDGQPEALSLKHGRLTATEGQITLWATPDEWWVDAALVADADNDGGQNIVLSVWKSGSFGPSKPFWVAENDPGVKNHLFVFAFRQGQIEPVWQSSNLAKPNCELIFADVNNDQEQELVVIEGVYGRANECQGKYLAVWKWDEWGFFNEWRSTMGNYNHIEPWLGTVTSWLNEE